jgi:hypothetical protein
MLVMEIIAIYWKSYKTCKYTLWAKCNLIVVDTVAIVL